MELVLTAWQVPPPSPVLVEDAVHLWRFPLACQQPLAHLLEEQERERARRLLSPAQARAFVVARARLRQILAVYLELAPQSLRFSYGRAGKPVLADHHAKAPAFNLAHSGGWGVCAVTRGSVVGVDIERLDRQFDYEKLAAQFFSAGERRWLQACTPARRRRLFFRIWTRKEAWLKGKGDGFSDPDQDISTPQLSSHGSHAGTWWLRSFPVARRYLAALALPLQPSVVQRWDGFPTS